LNVVERAWNKRVAIAIMILVVLPTLLTSTTRPVQAQLENTLVLVSGWSQASMQPIGSAFEAYVKETKGVDVTVQYIFGSSPELFTKIKTWAGTPDGDIFFGGEYSQYPNLTAAGLLEPYVNQNWNEIPSDFQGLSLKDSNGYWVTVNFLCPGFETNRDLLARLNLTEPKTWDDLLAPQYQGQITMATPARSGGNHQDVELILQSRGDAKGWAYLRRLAVNVGQWAARGLDVSNLVEKGEFAIGVAVAETSAVISREAGYDIGFVYPDVAFFSPSPVAILKGTTRPNLSKLFMDWIISEDGQKAILKGNLVPAGKDMKFSSYPNIPAAAILKDFMKADNIYNISSKSFPLNFTLYQSRYSEVNTIFDETIIQKLSDLTSAWNAIQDANQSVTGAANTLSSLEKTGYDVTKGNDNLTLARSLLDEALTNFDTGNYSGAMSASSEAKDLAIASTGLAEKLQWYQQPQYVAFVLVLAVIGLTGAIVTIKRRKK
jgi:iron(III) transport system substrate-binding protein